MKGNLLAIVLKASKKPIGDFVNYDNSALGLILDICHFLYTNTFENCTPKKCLNSQQKLPRRHTWCFG